MKFAIRFFLHKTIAIKREFSENPRSGNVTLKVKGIHSGFGDLEVARWPLVPKFAGSNPAEAVGLFRAKKNPQHAFLRKGSKAVCPMS